MQQFVECRYSDKKTSEAWYRECQRKGLPFVAIHPRRTYAAVRWDTFTMSEAADRWLQDNAKPILDTISGVYTDFALRNGEMRGTYSPRTGMLDNVAIEEAREMAGELYAILLQAIKATAPRPA